MGRKARALVAYLMLTDGFVDRDRLAGLLWGDRGADQARASLRQVLYELRSLTDGLTAPLHIQRSSVTADKSRLRTDVDELRALADTDAAGRFADLIGEQPGDLLSDLDGVDAGFDEWLTGQRARRQEERQTLGLAIAARAMAAGHVRDAGRLAESLLAAEPFDEAAVRLAMEARAALGDRSAVRQVFARHAQRLRDDLGLEPSPDLVALEARLSAMDAKAVERPPPVATRLARRRWWLAAGLAVLAVGTAGALTWLRGHDRPLLLRVEPLAVTAGDGPAQALRLGLSADLARMVVGSDARLRVEDPHDASPRLGQAADYRVTGEAQTGAGSLRANIRLLGRDGAILWSQSFTGPATEADALRARIAGATADVSICAEGGHAPPPRQMDAETMRLYLEGCEQKHGDWVLSARLLAQALQRRPDFAHAWAMLSAATVSNAPDDQAGDPARKLADAYARKALALDPNEGEAYDARAEALPGLVNWPQRVALLNEGHRRDPDNAIVDIDLAFDMAEVGRMREATEFAEAAVQHDPFSEVMVSQLIRLQGFSGRMDRVQTLLTEANRRWPADPDIAETGFRVMAFSGDPDEALRRLEDPHRAFRPDVATLSAWRAFLRTRRHGATGTDRTAAIAAIRAACPTGEMQHAPEAMLMLTALGDTDGAYAIAARYPDGGFTADRMLFYGPMARFRNDPRFMPFATRQGLVGVWRRTGRWPDACADHAGPPGCPSGG